MFTPNDVNKLRRVHKEVLARFEYVEDSKQYSDKLDWWAPIPPELLEEGTIKGDCDEFARICMLKLMGLGYQSRLVFCLDETKAGHLICEVTDVLNEEAYYLDNRKKVLVHIAALKGYKFLSVSPWNPTQGDSRSWKYVDQAAIKKTI